MGRVTVWIPDELERTVRGELPDVNWSAATQAGLRALLGCGHEHLTCAACGDQVPAAGIAATATRALVRDLMAEMRILVDSFGTAEGAGRVIHRVALAHGVTDPGPVPRTTRTARRQHADAAPVANLPTLAATSYRHPANPTKETA